ncbi:MAG: deoxyribodipyrimidine photo-lyase, partial [Thermoanaerobaculia bacterium]
MYWNRLYEKGPVERDRVIRQRLTALGMTVQSFNATLLVEPWLGVKDDGTPYRVFTPFWKRLQKLWRPPTLHAEPRALPGPKRWPASPELGQLALRPEHDWPDKLAGYW